MWVAFILCRYNEVAFLALSEVAPVTHAVGNTIKRVVIILASVIVFQNPLSPLGALGSAIAVFGCVRTGRGFNLTANQAHGTSLVCLVVGPSSTRSLRTSTNRPRARNPRRRRAAVLPPGVYHPLTAAIVPCASAPAALDFSSHQPALAA